MNYFSISDIKNHLETLTRDASSKFPVIYVNEFIIEIEGDEGRYSIPAANLDKITYYNAVQVSIYEVINGKTAFIKPNEDLRFKNFSWIKFFVYTSAQNKSLGSYIGARVPLDITYQLIREVYKVSRLKAFY